MLAGRFPIHPMITTLIVIVLFGLLLIVVETFLPGGILGTLGVLCILLAVVLTLTADELDGWPTALRTSVSAGIVVLSCPAGFPSRPLPTRRRF